MHSKNNFIRPYTSTDTSVIIVNTQNRVSYDIVAFNVNSTYVPPKSNCIIVKMRGSNNKPRIDFSSHSEALEALGIFQVAINLLKNNTNVNVPQNIITYVENMFSNYSMVFRQEQAINLWEVEHELSRYPSVMVLNDNMEVIEGEIRYISEAEIVVEFNSNISGWVFLN